jgi:L-alanine-DL-glutamate epimerase-like enolase superfamily enzyme
LDQPDERFHEGFQRKLVTRREEIAWIEEPVHPLDVDLHREIGAKTERRLATGENLFSRDDAKNLIRYAGLRKDRERRP